MKTKAVTELWEFYRDNYAGFKEPLRRRMRELDDHLYKLEAENEKLREAVGIIDHPDINMQINVKVIGEDKGGDAADVSKHAEHRPIWPAMIIVAGVALMIAAFVLLCFGRDTGFALIYASGPAIVVVGLGAVDLVDGLEEARRSANEVEG